jgi:hypothetical protein
MLEELGIGLVPFSPLGKGFLTGSITESAVAIIRIHLLFAGRQRPRKKESYEEHLEGPEEAQTKLARGRCGANGEDSGKGLETLSEELNECRSAIKGERRCDQGCSLIVPMLCAISLGEGVRHSAARCVSRRIHRFESGKGRRSYSNGEPKVTVRIRLGQRQRRSSRLRMSNRALSFFAN